MKENAMGLGQTAPILQDRIPDAQRIAGAARLPSVQPVTGPWLRSDEACGAQLALRRSLIETRRDDVIAERPGARGAVLECLDMVLEALGNPVIEGQVMAADGARIDVDLDDPLATLGRLVQQDYCILQKQGDEHVLTAAVLCFPALWTLAEKIGRPLIAIHNVVPEYDGGIATRVQRLFDGVRVGAPIWRANYLRYDDPSLYRPQREASQGRPGGPTSAYVRSERQTILRLPKTGAVAFSIHTSVVKEDV